MNVKKTKPADEMSTSAISFTDQSGKMILRGYDFADVVKNCIYEEIIYLLFYKCLPDEKQLKDFIVKISSFRENVNIKYFDFLQNIGLDAKFNISILSLQFYSALYPEENYSSIDYAVRLVTILPPSIAYWYHYNKTGERLNIYTDQNDSISTNFMKLLNLNNKEEIENFDFFLRIFSEISCAPPSIFGGKIAMSTNSKLAQCVTAFISIASGARHIGAVQNLIDTFSKLTFVDEAKSSVLKLLNEKKMVPGFGHAFFVKQSDPRFELFDWKIPQIKIKEKSVTLHNILQEILKMMTKEKGFFPNVDFYNAMTLNLVGIPYDLFFNCLIIARLPGSLSHILEQKENSNGKVFWKEFTYIGEKGLIFPQKNQRGAKF
jgi:2-methylcitrate synthase